MTKTVLQINTGSVNVFLIRGDGGAILVDAGNPGHADHILARLAKCGVAPHDVRLILITHGHVDHFGSAAELRERTGAPVAIHALDAGAVRQGIQQPDSLQPTHWLVALGMRIPGIAGPTRAPAFEPDIVFEGEWRLNEYTSTSLSGRVLHTPGHSDGSLSFHEPDRSILLVSDATGYYMPAANCCWPDC